MMRSSKCNSVLRLPRCSLPISLARSLLRVFSAVLVLASVTATPLCAASMKISEYQKQEWQVEDGLPQSNVRAIAQTPDGNLLIATSGGMVSFDGIHFKPVKVDAEDTIASEAVNALLVARNGDLWIGSDGRGIVIQRKDGGAFDLSENEGFSSDRIRMFYQASDGVVWAATQNGVERIHNEKIELFRQYGMIAGDLVSPFAEDEHGGIFFITSRGLFLWKNGSAQPLVLHHPEMGAPVAIYRDPRGRLWVGTMRGLLRLEPHGGGWDVRPVSGVHGTVSVMIGDADGNLWVGTRHSGICRIAPDGAVAYWTSGEGLPNDSIRALFIDDEQNLWIGMLNGGICRWRKAPLIPFGRPEGFPSEYAADILAARDGDLWMGTWGKGLFRMHQGRLEPASPPGMPLTMPIRALAQDGRGNIWVGTWFNGLYRYDGRSFKHYLLGIESPANAVSAIAFDPHGALWVGTYTGLLRFAGGVPEKGKGQMLLAGKLITCLHRERSGVMLAGTSTGLYRILGNNVQPVSGLSHPSILSIAEDHAGNTWIGTRAGGIDLLQGEHARHISTQGASPEYPVYSLLDDGDGYIWMGTTRGILRIPSQQLNALAHGERIEPDSLLLNRADGMRSSECTGASQPSAARAADGSLWFVTSRGYVHTVPAAAQIKFAQPIAHIESVTVDGVSMDDSWPLDLRPGTSEMVIHFTAKRLANPWHLEFRYRLDGYDKDWIMTRGRSAHYMRLPPGDYRFEVQARDAGDDWTAPEVALSLRQKPFFYQALWFDALLFAFFGLLLIQFIRWRMVRMKGALGVVIEERNRIAREWHDTLMAGFAAISWQLETSVRLFRESGYTSGPAMQACELARSMVSHCQAEARRVIWDLRDTDEPANMLSQALERTLATMANTGQIERRLEVIGVEVPLAPGSVHHLVRIGQEAVTNAIRHGNPNRIFIRLHYQRNALHFSVKDDGDGFQTSIVSEALRGHFGIPMMEERARKLGGTLHVESSTGYGTEIVVNVPFHLPPLAAGVQA